MVEEPKIDAELQESVHEETVEEAAEKIVQEVEKTTIYHTDNLPYFLSKHPGDYVKIYLNEAADLPGLYKANLFLPHKLVIVQNCKLLKGLVIPKLCTFITLEDDPAIPKNYILKPCFTSAENYKYFTQLKKSFPGKVYLINKIEKNWNNKVSFFYEAKKLGLLISNKIADDVILKAMYFEPPERVAFKIISRILKKDYSAADLTKHLAEDGEGLVALLQAKLLQLYFLKLDNEEAANRVLKVYQEDRNEAAMLATEISKLLNVYLYLEETKAASIPHSLLIKFVIIRIS